MMEYEKVRENCERMLRRFDVVIPRLERQIAREEARKPHRRLIAAHDVDERLEYRGFIIDEDPGDEDLRVVEAPNGTVLWGFDSVAQAAHWIDRWRGDVLAWIVQRGGAAIPKHLLAVTE